ncbi:flagellar basal body-associated FliL family protein [Latilactobacillus curvatus]|uniref:flagellar basal body-associated FliL family protein n=1 Tax=Latilactobacillus curvatus TaxID=28038 RepID=UPI0020A6042A|nr:flagellar basal body-associated FliL family protein [Latilactobacillus curvatus]MCP8877286.1 flagellar basal body-associated FliL family protein [Latilactobacillus curvatus]UTB75330.1 hypothetical protein A4W74_00755 [Latilactobacillus curvatus]
MKKNEEVETTETKAGGIKWGLLIVLVVVLAFGASAAGTIIFGKYFNSQDAKPKAEKVQTGAAISKRQRLVNVKMFIVNLATDDAADPQYLRLKVSLLVADDDQAKALKKDMPLVRDSMIRVLKPKRAADLLKNNQSIDEVKEQVKEAINKNYGSSIVQEVYVTDFVIQ